MNNRRIDTCFNCSRNCLVVCRSTTFKIHLLPYLSFINLEYCCCHWRCRCCRRHRRHRSYIQFVYYLLLFVQTLSIACVCGFGNLFCTFRVKLILADVGIHCLFAQFSQASVAYVNEVLNSHLHMTILLHYYKLWGLSKLEDETRFTNYSVCGSTVAWRLVIQYIRVRRAHRAQEAKMI